MPYALALALDQAAWLLEELDLPYGIVPYQRNLATRLAPPALKAIHPLGKSPVIRDGDLTVAESGAIIEYLVGRYDNGRVAPARDFASPDYVAYQDWLHFAEGSAMLPLLLRLYVGLLREAGAPLKPRIDSELRNHFGYMSPALGERDYFRRQHLLGRRHPTLLLARRWRRSRAAQGLPNLVALHERLKARRAYQRALARGGPYEVRR